MATASRSTAELNALYTSTIEKWMGEGRVEEIVFTANELIWLLSRVSKQVGNWGFEAIQPLMTTKNTGVGWFEYDDSLSIDSMPGPEAAKFGMAFLGGPLVITEQEEIENRQEHRMVNMLRFKFDQLMLSAAEEVNISGFRGSGTNSKSIDGLEDMIFAGDDNAGTVEDANRDEARNGVDNTYGGIARGGGSTLTGWENHAYDLTNATAADRIFSAFDGPPYRTLLQAYMHCTRGAIRPDLIISSLKPYIDIQRLFDEQSLYRREVDSWRGVQMGHENFKFRSAMWIYDESATIHADAGSDATTDSDTVYLLNSMFMKMPVEQDYDFALTGFQTPVDARISIAHILWRGQIFLLNPRYTAVLHGYNVAS